MSAINNMINGTDEVVFYVVHYANGKVGRTMNDFKAIRLQEVYNRLVHCYLFRGEDAAERLALLRAKDTTDGGWDGDCTRGRKGT